MKRCLYLFFCLVLATALFPQAGNLKACLKKTKLFVDLFNNRQYSQIHQLLDSNLQSQQPKARFIAYLQDTLFAQGGKVLGVEHLNQTQQEQHFLLRFERMSREVHLSLNAADEISTLNFLQVQTLPPVKKSVTLPNHDNTLKTALDSVVHRLCLEYMSLPQSCALSIGLLWKGKPVFYNYGETQRGSSKLPDSNSVYEAGSISKTLSGLLLAQAIVEKRIEPEDDIRRFLPGRYPNLAYGNTPITAVHLANHSSGLPRIPDNLFAQDQFDSLNPYKSYTEKMLFQDLKSLVIEQPPGALSAYSNYGMAVLGKVLENSYKKPYSELVQEKILDHLRMNKSCMEMTESLRPNFLPGYTAAGIEAKHWDLGVFAPAGGLHSCTADLLKFVNYQLTETDSACRLSHKISIDKNEKLGLAWYILSQKNSDNLFWHNGATFGFSSFCGFIPEKNAGLVLLSNASASLDHIAIQLLRFLSKSQSIN